MVMKTDFQWHIQICIDRWHPGYHPKQPSIPVGPVNSGLSALIKVEWTPNHIIKQAGFVTYWSSRKNELSHVPLVTKVKTHINEVTHSDTPECSARPFALVLSLFLSLSSHFFAIHISMTEFPQLLHFLPSVSWGQGNRVIIFFICSGQCPSFLVL